MTWFLIGLAEAELKDRLNKRGIMVASYNLSEIIDFALPSPIVVKNFVSMLKIRLRAEGN
jgi:hypothetical protein